MLFVKETPRRHGDIEIDPDAAKPSFSEIARTVWKSLTSSPALMLTMAGGVSLHFILGAAAFDQLWYVRERGFDAAEVAQLSGWIAMIAGVLGNLFGGIGSDAFMRRTGQGRPMFLFWIMLVLLPLNIVYRLVPGDSIWFYIGIFAGFFQLGCFYGPTFATVQDLVPPQIRGTMVAFYLLSLNLFGLGIGITAGGICIDMMRDAGVAEPYTWTLLTFTVISALALPCFLAAGLRYRRDQQALADKLAAEQRTSGA